MQKTATKSGKCPAPEIGICVTECNEDSECEGNKKCVSQIK